MVFEGDVLKEYLGKVLEIPRDSLTLRRITTNRTNIIDVCTTPDRKLIIKQYLPHVAGIPEVKMSEQRSVFEHRAMLLFKDVIGEGTVPDVIHFDKENHIIIMSFFVHDLTFEEEQNYERLTEAHFTRIGSMIGTLHSSTFGKSGLIQHEVSDFTDYDITRTGAAMRHYPGKVRAIQDAMASLPKCVIWADCCPKNMLIRGDDICFIDLEFCHYGSPVIDIGFFIGHVLLFAMKDPGSRQQLTDGINTFLESYISTADHDGAEKIVEQGLVHAGMLLIHKTDSIGQYEQYAHLKEDARVLAERLMEAGRTRLDPSLF